MYCEDDDDEGDLDMAHLKTPVKITETMVTL
jgi:hypothetical protein